MLRITRVDLSKYSSIRVTAQLNKNQISLIESSLRVTVERNIYSNKMSHELWGKWDEEEVGKSLLESPISMYLCLFDLLEVTCR